MSTVVCSWVTIAQIAEVCLPQIDKFIARRVFHYQHQRLGFFFGVAVARVLQSANRARVLLGQISVQMAAGQYPTRVVGAASS